MTSKQNSEKWDLRFLEVAKLVSTWSKDPSTKVGAVLTKDCQIVGTGFNGFAKGVEDSDARYADRDLKYKLVVHAEANACIQAGRLSRGGTLYVYPGFGPPCMCVECCKTVIQSGVHRVVGLLVPQDAERIARWKESLAIAQTMCDEAGIITEQYRQ